MRICFQSFIILCCFISSAALAQESASGSDAATGSSAPVAGSNYVLQPLDVISIKVFQEPELAQVIRVSAEGDVTLPLIGRVDVAQMTVTDVRKRITALYDRDYLVDPQITVQVVEYNQRRIHIHGLVNRPGPITIPPEEKMTLSQAISAAGGIGRLGNESSLTIKRIDKNGKSQVFEVDFDEILRNPNAKDIYLQDGDVINVPERRI